MTQTQPLSHALARRILQRFDLPIHPPADLETLTRLLQAYTRQAPWESASRIARRAQVEEAEGCAILGGDFWESHFAYGTGGTCFESNYAFFGLLRWIGYEGYLTINDMGASIGCHSAIVVLLGGQKYLVDVGYPLHAILPLRFGQETEAASPFMRYRVKSHSDCRYEIWRDLPKHEIVFHLNDKAIGEAEYRAITFQDYRHDGGLFLNEIVINKVIDDQLWRFNSDELPLRLQQFVAGQRRDHALEGDVAGHVAAKFGIARDLVAAAMGILKTDDN